MCIIKVTLTVLLLVVLTEAKLAPTVKFSNGYDIPLVGFGTYLSHGNDVANSIGLAIDAGYRHIDSAFLYENEAEVGDAIRAKIQEGVINREDIFVTTKLWNTFHEPDQVEKAFYRSLKNLDLDYIDLYLMHFPVAFERILKSPNADPNDVDSYKLKTKINPNVDYVDTWRAMEKLVASGRVRSIGVSNFNVDQLKRILSVATIKPVNNQVEINPRKNKRAVIRFCAENNITVTAHTPLGRPKTPEDNNSPITNPRVIELAEKYQKTPAQIILRYEIQLGAIVIPKSTKKQRIMENFNLFDFKLSENDMQIMHTLNGH